MVQELPTANFKPRIRELSQKINQDIKEEETVLLSELEPRNVKSRRKKYKRRRNDEFFSPQKLARYMLFFCSMTLFLRYQNSKRKIKPIVNLEDSLEKSEEKDIQLAENKMLSDSNLTDEMLPRLAMKPIRYSEANPTLEIPANIDRYFANLSTKADEMSVPVFWHILKSGGTSLKDMYGDCMNKTEASESGVLNNHTADETLKVVQVADGGIRYVNVDTTTNHGIKRAKDMKLVESGLADIIFTPMLHEASELFSDSNHKAQCFGLFRHPVDRAVSLFNYLKKATWEPTFSEKLKNIKSIEDYAISEFAEDNWITRFLNNKMIERVTKKDLDVAKEILRRKCVIGLTLDLSGSVERFNHYFGWKLDESSRTEACLNRTVNAGSNRNQHEIPEENGIGWRILRSNNLLDMELYEYALQLYEEQGALFKLG